MQPLLFLAHRIPFPPTKGDKVRSFHLLRYLSERYRVHLGAFADDPADLAQVPRLDDFCESHRVEGLSPMRARVRSLSGLGSGKALTLGYFRSGAMARWVRATVERHDIRRVLVFSSAMAQYVARCSELCVVVDFVDVDSAKWAQYAAVRRWPVSWVFRRESERLLAFEREVSRSTAASVFVTAAEADMFRELAPECAAKVHHVQNGVDGAYFSPEQAHPTPFAEGEIPIVFTGAMDYWPNVDAVRWFAREVLPAVRALRPEVLFYIVGMNPTQEVQALARVGSVVVTGRVPDVRPYLQHARVVVAPLRVARGIQNKVLDAMAMARPVVVSTAAARSLAGRANRDFAVADDAAEFAGKVTGLLAAEPGEAMGRAARARVIADYDWETNLAAFATLLAGATAPGGRASYPVSGLADA
jgi:polysaccharide biosynthesis protein PslH